jgi:hypothetical protein
MSTTDKQAKSGLPDEPVAVYRVSRDEHPPLGGWIVWNPTGTGKLRLAHVPQPAECATDVFEGRALFEASSPESVGSFHAPRRIDTGFQRIIGLFSRVRI